MNGPVELLLRVDCVEYARTVLVFCKRRTFLCYYGNHSVQKTMMRNIDHINPFVVRRLLAREVR